MSSRAAALLCCVITMLLAISSVHASALAARLQAPPVAPASAQTMLEGITVTVTALLVPTSLDANTADGVPVTKKLSPVTKPE